MSCRNAFERNPLPLSIVLCTSCNFSFPRCYKWLLSALMAKRPCSKISHFGRFRLHRHMAFIPWWGIQVTSEWSSLYNFVFLRSTSATRLYRGRVPRLMSDNFLRTATHETERGGSMNGQECFFLLLLV